VVTTAKKWPTVSRRRLDILDIRLFGLPEDKESGAPGIPGEFDRIDRRIDELPARVAEELRKR
jgi:hypothetical protein